MVKDKIKVHAKVVVNLTANGNAIVKGPMPKSRIGRFKVKGKYKEKITVKVQPNVKVTAKVTSTGNR